jgi:flagellar hook assembly protein FlgD
MPRQGPVFAALYDARGRLARTLFVGTLRAGRHTIRWDGTVGGGADAAAGVYFLAVKAAGSALNTKVVVLR